MVLGTQLFGRTSWKVDGGRGASTWSEMSAEPVFPLGRVLNEGHNLQPGQCIRMEIIVHAKGHLSHLTETVLSLK